LTDASDWHGCYKKRNFHSQLKFSPKRTLIDGGGTDENEVPVSVVVDLYPSDVHNWSGYYETDDQMA